MCWDDFSHHNPSKYVELNHSNGEFLQLTAEQSDSEISNSGHRHPNPFIPQLLDYKNQVKKSFQITKLDFRKSAAILLMKFDISWFVRTKIVAHFSQFDSRYSKLFLPGFIPSSHQISRDLLYSLSNSRSRCHFAPSKNPWFFLEYMVSGVIRADRLFLSIHPKQTISGQSLVPLESVRRLLKRSKHFCD